MENLSPDLTENLKKAGWIATSMIAGGGGGTVYRCINTKLCQAVRPFMPHRGPMGLSMEESIYEAKMVDQVLKILQEPFEAFGALKVPYQVEDEKTKVRLNQEIEAMGSCNHPALIHLFDYDKRGLPEWFVMEFHALGILTNHAHEYKGKPLDVLLAIRLLVEGLALVHEKGYVHRDIKPGNIFVASDRRLVLGDFGIVFTKEDDRTKITIPGQLEFSRDWIPDWVRNRELDDYKKKVDIFMLAKVIYFMVSGGKKVLASQIDDDEFNLMKTFPDINGIDLIYEFLLKAITNKEKDCKFEDANEFYHELNEIVDLLAYKPTPQLCFSFFPSHSTSYFNIPMTGGHGLKEIFSTEVLIPYGSKRFRAFARVATKVGMQSVQLRFKLKELESNTTQCGGKITPESGLWIDEMILQTPKFLPQGRYELIVDGNSDQVGGLLTGFNFYRE